MIDTRELTGGEYRQKAINLRQQAVREQYFHLDDGSRQRRPESKINWDRVNYLVRQAGEADRRAIHLRMETV